MFGGFLCLHLKCKKKKMENIVLFDGQLHHSLLPITFTRPVSHIRVGIFTIKEKWEKYLGESVSVRCKDYLTEKFNSKESEAKLGISGGLLPDNELISVINKMDEQTILMKDDIVLAIAPLPANDKQLEEKLNEYQIVNYDADINMIQRPHDIFMLNGLEIEKDFLLISDNVISADLDSSNTIIGHQLIVEEGAKVVASIINCEDGPVYIGKNAEVMEGSIIRGPFALLDNAVVKMGSKIYGPTTFGPHSKVGGEVNNSVIQGYSNKAHDGYLGNSVIGEWCNLGADTNTSNLKNNYSTVKVWSYKEKNMIDTGTQYCGLTMGDHSKCSINTMFNTGTVVGVYANIFDSGFPPKHIPSFSWGTKNGLNTYDLDKAIELAEKVMYRRNVKINEFDKKILSHIHQLTATHRASD